MKVVLNIPDEFLQHFYSDRFKDSLERLEASHLLAGNYERELCQMLIKAFDESLVFSEATIEQLREDESPCNNCQEFDCTYCEYNRIKGDTP